MIGLLFRARGCGLFFRLGLGCVESTHGGVGCAMLGRWAGWGDQTSLALPVAGAGFVSTRHKVGWRFRLGRNSGIATRAVREGTGGFLGRCGLTTWNVAPAHAHGRELGEAVCRLDTKFERRATPKGSGWSGARGIWFCGRASPVALVVR